MQNLVSEKPYVPVKPYDGQVWARLMMWYLPRLLRKKYDVVEVKNVHAERLEESIAAGHGILLAPNHVRDEDPMVLGMLAKEVGTPFFIMASWHLFMEDKWQAFLLRRAGAFSIYREGIDRSAINTAIEILEEGKRPLVIFPEGHISRTNDRLNELLEGSAMMPRAAAKKRAKMEPPKKVVVHPVALRYHFEGNIDVEVNKVLDDIEQRLTWRKQKHLSMMDRIRKTGGALLALKELEYLGHATNGDVGPRLAVLMDAILNPLEDRWLKQRHEDSVPSRVKRLRTAILPDLTKGELDEAERQSRWEQLEDLYLAQQLFHYPPDYVGSNPTPERLLETIERFEEDLTDKVSLHGPIRATVTVGEAIEVSPAREGRGGSDPLLVAIEQQLRGMLGIEGTP